MAWKIYDEAVEMVQRRFQYLPRAFCWRGRRFEVEAVERSWLASRRGRARRFFQVVCADGVFELYQDLKAGTWHLRRARLFPSPAPVVRAVAPAWR